MDDVGFRLWLEALGDAPNTINTRRATVRRVESAYGDLGQAHENGEIEAILTDLEYSSNDRNREEPNRSKIVMEGDLYNGLATCRTHLRKYVAYLEALQARDSAEILPETKYTEVLRAGEGARTFQLESDLQSALRTSIAQLESSLSIIDGGSETKVDSGFIDILGQDAAGTLVLIELKAVRARRDAVGQILGYMGDIQDQMKPVEIRGILIAPEFDTAVISASRAVPNLALFSYSFTFSFSPIAP